jgi:RimJ/RimL family protein N-acetyltransferase
MPEQLLDISQAKQFLDAKKAYWYIWHLIENWRSREVWVDKLPHITSLMVVAEQNRRPYYDTDADICIEADSKEALFDLLSVLESSKNYSAILHREWMWPIFENELNATFQNKQYAYGLVRTDFTPQIRHPVRELSANDAALIETIPGWERELTFRHFQRTSKSFGIVEDNQLVSYTCAWESGDEREIDWVYTRPDKRRQGYGTSVVSAATEYIFRTGGRKVTATVDWNNVGSLRIWEKLGFHPEEATAHYILHGRKLSI